MNMRKEVVLPDRLGGEKQITFIPVQFVQKTKRLCPEEEEEEEDDDNAHVENRSETRHVINIISFYFYFDKLSSVNAASLMTD